MIRSETKTFRYRIVVGSFIFFLLFFSCTLLSGSNDKDFFWMIVFNIMMFLISGGELWRTAKKITIDPMAEVINFTNLFTRISKTYSFRDLDGYAESDLPSSTWYGTYRGCRVLYLVQNGYFIEIISSDIYSNMEELSR